MMKDFNFLTTNDTLQIEATEQKFAEEARKEEEEVLRLKEEIKKDEELAAKASNKAEKLKILREERVRTLINMW